MNLKDKLSGLPHIYYVNLDNRTDRRDHMESQFEKWKIKNVTRISSSKYLSSEYDSWKHILVDYDTNPIFDCPFNPNHIKANAITHIEAIKTWLESTNDPYMIMMEDDYDLNLIEYWNFDWTYLMNNIPYDWDCIQLGFENARFLPFFLHPKMPGSYFGPVLLNRKYAEKIVRLHCVGDKYAIYHNVCEHEYKTIFPRSGTVDYFMCNNGKTYSIPLITISLGLGNHGLFEDENESSNSKSRWDRICIELYYDWWMNKHHKFSLRDFFTYGKPNDSAMTARVNVV